MDLLLFQNHLLNQKNLDNEAETKEVNNNKNTENIYVYSLKETNKVKNIIFSQHITEQYNITYIQAYIHN